MIWFYIYLTKNQRDSLLGQLKWVDMESGMFYCSPSCWRFLKRIGAVEFGNELTPAGITLMADFGNNLKRKIKNTRKKFRCPRY